jgi:hypothetical protein
MATVNVVGIRDLRVDAPCCRRPDWNYLTPTRTTLFYTFGLT